MAMANVRLRMMAIYHQSLDQCGGFGIALLLEPWPSSLGLNRRRVPG
jgi:hypothetical protein